MRWHKVLRWLPPVVFLLLGGLFYFFVDGHGFLGVVFWAVCGLCVADNLLHLWSRRNLTGAKLVRLLISGAVIVVVLAGVFTLPPILQSRTEDPAAEAEYLLLLGAGVKGTEPSPLLQDRIDRAYTYLTEHPDTICIVSGGLGSMADITEAQCMFDRLTARGIAPERICMEEQATSTAENFRYTLALIEAKTGTRPEKLVVLTNEFHLYRAGLIAEDQGVEATFINAPTSSWSVRLTYTLREIFALWKYLVFGG